MLALTDMTGLAGVAGAGAALVALVPGVARLASSRLIVLQSVVFGLMLVPVSDLPLAGYLRGVTGDLSILSLVLIGCSIARPAWANGEQFGRQRRTLLTFVVLAAILLYPLSLGLTGTDPYRLGFNGTPLIVAMLSVAIAAWALRVRLIAVCISLAMLAWAMGWYESTNLWDYLIDPWIVIYALWVVTLAGARDISRTVQHYRRR